MEALIHMFYFSQVNALFFFCNVRSLLAAAAAAGTAGNPSVRPQALSIQKALLRRHETVTLSTTLQDVSVYVFAYWVLEFLAEHRLIAR